MTQWDYNRLLVEAEQQPDGDPEEATTVALRNLNRLEGALREAEAELATVREELGYADLMARAVPLLEHDRDSFRSKAEVRGTSSCPLCGIDTPHAHHDEEIAKWVNAQSARFGLRALVYRFDDQILVETDEEIGYWDWEQRTHEASSLEDVFAELKQFATKLAATSRAKLTAAKEALREAEAKAALATEAFDALELIWEKGKSDKDWTADDAAEVAQTVLLRRDALQQPKAVTHRQADRHGDGFGN